MLVAGSGDGRCSWNTEARCSGGAAAGDMGAAVGLSPELSVSRKVAAPGAVQSGFGFPAGTDTDGP